MTLQEKIEAIEKAGWPIAFDGCHKIYFLQDKGREAQAREFGYEIYPASDLKEFLQNSCSLVFATRWGYDNDDFADPHNIEQGDEELHRFRGTWEEEA